MWYYIDKEPSSLSKRKLESVGPKSKACAELRITGRTLLFSLLITAAHYNGDLGKPFDVSLKGSFQLINVVILSVGTKKTLEPFIW